MTQTVFKFANVNTAFQRSAEAEILPKPMWAPLSVYCATVYLLATFDDKSLDDLQSTTVRI
jgi:hypothetical protein